MSRRAILNAAVFLAATLGALRTFMPRASKSRSAALALLLAPLGLLQTNIANAAPATVCVVGGACHGADLKAAIAAASAGAVIEVSAGEVTQAGIEIDRNLTIRGQGASSI